MKVTVPCFFVPSETTHPTGTQIKDAIDMKRMMMTVIIAMIPCLLFGMWNVGHQHYLAIGGEATFLDKLLIGAFRTVPIIVGLICSGTGH